jgi:hypothetical protein
MTAATLLLQSAEIADVIADDRRCVGMQVRHQQTPDRHSVKLGACCFIALDDYIGMRDVKISRTFHAFSGDRAHFRR